ncbi:pre-toxin TG domain-containing protein [Priestia endophytica]
MTKNGGYTIEVDPDKLDELASGIGTAEMKCSFALSKLKWGMGSIAADIAGVGGGNINHLQEKFEGSIKKYKDLLDDSQAFVKKTAADVRQLDQSWQAKLGRTVGEFSGWYDLQRTFGEYDPQTGEKITGGQRAEAGVMTILNFSPGKAIGVFAKGGKMAKTAKIGQEASALGKINSGRKAVNPAVFKDFFSGAWNSMKGRFRSAKEYIVKGKEAVKKVGNWQIPSLQKQLIGPNGVRLQNNPTVKEAGQYLYKTVKDGGQQVAKVVTEGSRAVKEGGAKVVRNMNNFNFGAYLRKAKGDPPAGMKRPHAHHVAVKGLFMNRKKIVRSYAEYGRKLLRDVDIDPIFGLENLHWAPNKGHSNAYIKEVTKELHRLKRREAPREAYVEKLEEIARLLNTDEGFPPPKY